MIKLDTKRFDAMKVLQKAPDYMKDYNLKTNDKIVEFDTLAAYKKFCVHYKDFDDSNKDASMKKRDWAGSLDYDEFLEILDKGDSNVMSSMKTETTKEVNSLHKKYEEVISGYKFNVSGQFFDVGLVLSGVPETWLEPEFEETEKVQVELLIDGAFSAIMDKNNVVEGASRILAITKLLEEVNVQVKIRIIAGNDGYNKSQRKNKGCMYISTLVKDYDEPINYKKMSALLSPTYQRRGLFKMIEVVAGNNVIGGYGYIAKSDNSIQLDDKRKIDALEKKLFKEHR